MQDNNSPYLWQQVASALFAAANKLQMQGDTSLEQLTSRQLMLMIALSHLSAEDSTIINIAKMLGASKQSTAQMVEILKRKKYIVAKPSLKDKRAVNLSLTQEGTRVTLSEFNIGMSMFSDFFKDFSARELEQFLGFLRRL